MKTKSVNSEMEFDGKTSFYLSILVILVFPLLPLLWEGISADHIFDTSIALIACIYCITVLTTSRNIFQVFFSIIPATVLAIIYSKVLSIETLKTNKSMVAIYEKGQLLENTLGPIRILKHEWFYFFISVAAIIIVALIHASERYRRHYIGNESFLTKYK